MIVYFNEEHMLLQVVCSHMYLNQTYVIST